MKMNVIAVDLLRWLSINTCKSCWVCDSMCRQNVDWTRRRRDAVTVRPRSSRYFIGTKTKNGSSCNCRLPVCDQVCAVCALYVLHVLCVFASCSVSFPLISFFFSLFLSLLSFFHFYALASAFMRVVSVIYLCVCYCVFMSVYLFMLT